MLYPTTMIAGGHFNHHVCLPQPVICVTKTIMSSTRRLGYGDKLPARPWYIFTPPRRYIFPPPLTGHILRENLQPIAKQYYSKKCDGPSSSYIMSCFKVRHQTEVEPLRKTLIDSDAAQATGMEGELAHGRRYELFVAVQLCGSRLFCGQVPEEDRAALAAPFIAKGIC